MEDEMKKATQTEENVEFSIKRDDFVETFFKKGAEFASELIVELDELREDNKRLSTENAALRNQLASDDAIRELLKKIEVLEQEKHKLSNYAETVAETKDDYAGRYAEVEKELDSMANLYVALYQLHATLDQQEILGVIEQLLAQFVGAGSFAIYLQRNIGDSQMLIPIHAYHCNKAVGTQIKWNEGPIGEAAATQIFSTMRMENIKKGDPLACIPMVLNDKTIGVIAIMGFFEQKDSFVDIDFEFFKLLATHSASAIVASGLMAHDGKGVESSLANYERL
jgi:GAF domain